MAAVPRWMAKVNRKIFNPMELKRGKRPVLIHVGRTSGTEYRTPLDAHKVDGGYIFIVMYGSRSDWVKNIVAAGNATLLVAGVEISLANPRMISRVEAASAFEAVGSKAKLHKKAEFLRLDQPTTVDR